jgi:hypothetical protein
MTCDKKLSNGRSTKVDAREARRTPAPAGLSIAEFPGKTLAQHGSDPYNTSGSFDRKMHWTRVAKR